MEVGLVTWVFILLVMSYKFVGKILLDSKIPHQRFGFENKTGSPSYVHGSIRLFLK